MRNTQLFLLGSLILLSGLYSGQMFHEMMGAQSALQTIDDHTYVVYWQSLDKLMHVRMPFMSNFLLLVFLINLITLQRYRQHWHFWALSLAFLCLIAETTVTVKLQLPVNARIQSLNPLHLPSGVAALKAATFNHFIIRSVLRFASFILLVVSALKLARQG